MSQKVEIEIRLDNKHFAEDANTVKMEISAISRHAASEGEKMGGVFDGLGKKVAGAFAVSKLVEFEKKVIDVRGEMESLRISFETLAGEHLGKQLYEDIKQFATTTPMMMNDLAKGAQTLLGFNIEAGKVMPILREIGDISMGDAQKFNSLTLAFAQMSSTGKLMGQDLLQMINAGFNPLVVISEKTGKSVSKLKEEMSEGRITVEMVEDAFRSATAEGGKFHGMLEKQSKGIRGSVSNLQGAWQDMLNDIGEKQQGLMVDGAKLATTLVQNYEKVGQVLLGLVTTYGTYKAAVIAVTLAESAMNGTYVMKIRLLRSLAAAQALLNKTMLANPYVAAATALGLLVGAIIASRDGLTDAERAQRDYNATLEEAKKRQEEYNGETQEAIRLAQDDSAATGDREGAMQLLINRYPDIIQKYIDEKGHLTDILGLKREIAAYDAQMANEDNRINAELYRKYVEVLKKAKSGKQLNETEDILYAGAKKKYNAATPWYQRLTGSWTSDAADYFSTLANEAGKAYGRGIDVARITSYMEKMGSMRNEDLKQLTEVLEKNTKSLKEGESVFVKEIGANLNASDIQGLTAKANGIIDARSSKNKELTDKEKSAAAKAASQTAREQAESQARLTELELEYQNDLTKIRREAEESRRAAEIAQIQDDSERERAERKYQYEKSKSAVMQQEADIYKAIYEARKKAYEAANKGQKYENTGAGAKGYGIDETTGKYVMEGTLDPKELELYKASVEKMYADLSVLDASHAREQQQYTENLIRQYQSYADQRLEIEKNYQNDVAAINAAIAEARARGDQETVGALTRSLGEAAKRQMKELSEVAMKELQDSPLYSLAWKDLGTVSTDTLNMLIAKFKEFEGQFSADPQAMREWTERIKAMSDEVALRNPFKAIYEAREELEKAVQKQDSLKGRISEIQEEIDGLQELIDLDEKTNSSNETTIKNKNELAKKQQELKDTTDALGEAIVEESEARGKEKQSWNESRRQVDELASAISALGDEIAGEAGRILNLIGSVMTFATTTADGMKKVAATGAESISTIEKASVILTIISAAISLAKQISELIPDDHGQYEKFADKQKEIRKMTDAVHEYELAVLEARNAEQNWFASSKLNSLSNQWLVSSKASENYFKKLTELQATYQNESGSGWLTKLGAQANKTIASISGAVNKAFGIDGTFVGDLQTKLAQTVWASTIGGPVGVGMTAENDIWKKGWDKNYVEGLTAAWKNLRIETRAASKGFLGTGIGGKSQKTEDLREYVKKNLGLDLFDENTGWLNEETYDIVMKKYGDKLVGETKETLEALKDLKDKHDEFIDQLHDYVNEMYAPIMTNFTDAMWDWYDEGKDALDSFREAAGDTFRNIVSDLLNTQMLKLFGNEMSETISKLYEDYFDKGTISESQLMSGVTAAVDKASMQFQQAQPVLQQTMTMVEQALNSYGISMKESAEYFDDLSSSFSDMLLDMTDDLDDFAKSVKKKMYAAMLDVFVYNSPFETIVNGEKKTFDSFYAYLEDWKTRTQKIIEGTDKTWAEQLSAEEAASRIAQLKTSIANLDKLIAGSTDEAEIARLKGTIAELQGLIGQIEQGQNVDFAAREQERLEKQNDELRESYNILKNISKTYAELSGWGMEAQIDASPFANLGEDLLSVLQDTSKSVDDWKDEIIKKMTDDLVKELVYNDDYKNTIRKFQEIYVNAMAGDESSLEALKEQLKEYEEVWDEAGNLIWNLGTKEGKQAFIDWIAGKMADFANSTAESADIIANANKEAETSFGDLHDSFMDAIFDMENGAKNLSKKLRETLAKDLVEKNVFGKAFELNGKQFTNFDEYQKDWTTRYLDALEKGDEALIEELVKELEEREEAMAKSAEDTVKAIQEAVKDTTFKDMSDSFVSALMDMESTAEDWSDSIGRTMAQRIIEKTLVTTTIQPLLDKLQDSFNDAMEAGKDADGVIDWHKVLGDKSLTAALENIKAAFPDLRETVDAILGKLGITKEAEAAKTAFDDLTDTIISGLTDAEMTAEKFGQNIAKTLTTQMMKSMLEGKYATTIRNIQEEWAAALESGDTDAIESVKKRIVQLYRVMGKDTRELREIFKEIEESVEDVDTTFKDMADSWSSALTDMDTDAADWGRQIGKTLVSRLVSELVVGKHLQQYLDDIQSAYDRALEKYGDDEDGMAKIVAEVTPAINAAVEATRQWEPAVEAVSKAFEKLEYSTTPFDSLEDSFVSSLMDMESTAADLGNDIGRELAEAMIQEFVLGDAFRKQLEDWKQRYRDIMGTEGVDEEDRARQLNQLKSDIAAAREGYVAEAMRIQDILGTSVYPDQNATVNMADKATYDQFETYLGIATSQQICSEQQLSVQQQILSTLQMMSGLTGTGGDNPQLRELCGLAQLGNDYLMAIRETGKGIKSMLDMHLASMDAKLSNLNKL